MFRFKLFYDGNLQSWGQQRDGETFYISRDESESYVGHVLGLLIFRWMKNFTQDWDYQT